MKRQALFILIACFSFQMAANAQEEKTLFNHMALGVSVGTDGIGVDAAVQATNFLGIRVGGAFMPHLKFSGDYDIDSESASITSKTVTIEGKIQKVDAKVLFDFFPFRKSSFHVTAGAYIGGSKVLSLRNKNEFLAREDWGVTGVKIGDYRITSDDEGNVKADIRVNAFKPYLGIGFGRTMPRNKRIGVMCDLGVKFWGKPGVWANSKDDWGEVHYTKLRRQDFSEDDSNSADANKAIDIMEKIIVYPVLNIRICGRLF